MTEQTPTSQTLIGTPHVTLNYEKGHYKVAVSAPIEVKVRNAWYDPDKGIALLELSVIVNLSKKVVIEGHVEVETKGEDLISIYETAEKKAAEIIANNMNTVMRAASNAIWTIERYNRDKLYLNEVHVIKKILYNVMNVDEIEVMD